MTKQAAKVDIGERTIYYFSPTPIGRYNNTIKSVKYKASKAKLPLRVTSMEQLAICLREIYCKNRKNSQLTYIKNCFEGYNQQGCWPFWTSTFACSVLKDDVIGYPAGIFAYEIEVKEDSEIPEVKTLWEQVNCSGFQNEKGLRTSPCGKVRFAQYGTKWFRFDKGNGGYRDESDWEKNLEDNSIVRALAKELGAESLAEVTKKRKMRSLICAVSVDHFPKDSTITEYTWISHISKNGTILDIGGYSNSLFPFVRALPTYEINNPVPRAQGI